jgi:methylmalonyl-CoA/ethylmalonyl-CoA epimerase
MNDSTNPTFGLSQIGQIAVPVSNLEKAVAFYRDSLGMRFLFQAPPGLAFFDLNGIRLLLDMPAKKAPEVHASIIYYKVPDLQAAYETLLSRGVSFEEPPGLVARMPDHELWMAFFRDPDANLLALMSELPLKG